MFSALLCAHLLVSTPPSPDQTMVSTARSVAVTLAVQPAAAPLLPALGALLPMSGEEHDPSIQPGLRNMAIGAAVGGAGLAVLVSAGVLFTGVVAAVVVASFFVPGVAQLWGFVVTPVAGVCSVMAIVGTLLFILGALWGGINLILVIQRLSPGYKGGPSSDYLGF